jgi:hypothetical protein
VAFAAHFGIGGLTGFLGVAGTAGELLLVFAVLGVVMMTLEAFDVIPRVVLDMFEKGIACGAAILNAVGDLGGFDGEGGEAENADQKEDNGHA